MNDFTGVIRKYAVFKGRARRKEFWMFIIWNFAILVLVSFIAAILLVAVKGSLPTILIDAYNLYCLAVIIPTLAVYVRRLHDTGRSGWWFFVNAIPLVGWIASIVFLAQESASGDNQYGPSPKGAAQAPALSPTAG